jgi:rubrerythrin
MNNKKYIDILKTVVPRKSLKVKTQEQNSTILNELVSKNPIEIEDIDPKRRDLEILRLSIIAEYDAVNLYEQFAEMANSSDIKKVLLDIAKEEKVHIAELETLLDDLDNEEEETNEEGEDEIEDLI